MKWNFDCVADNGEDSAVAELKKAMRENANMFWGKPDFSTGKDSWEWSSMEECKQQLVKRDKFDPSDRYFRGGAHMPLMVFIGKKNGTRRKPDALARRQVKADKRGYNRERIEAMKMCRAGGGRWSSSDQQVNATRGGGDWSSSVWSWNHTSQAGKPNTDWWASSSSSSNKWK